LSCCKVAVGIRKAKGAENFDDFAMSTEIYHWLSYLAVRCGPSLYPRELDIVSDTFSGTTRGKLPLQYANRVQNHTSGACVHGFRNRCSRQVTVCDLHCAIPRMAMSEHGALLPRFSAFVEQRLPPGRVISLLTLLFLVAPAGATHCQHAHGNRWACYNTTYRDSVHWTTHGPDRCSTILEVLNILRLRGFT
jgi:hypothetical protein